MTSEINGLKRNSEYLLHEVERLSKKEEELLARIALLESSLTSEKDHSASLEYAKANLEAKFKEREKRIKKLDEVNESLLRKADQLDRLKETYQAVKKNNPHSIPDYSRTSSPLRETYRKLDREAYGKTSLTPFRIPVYLQPVTDLLEHNASHPN